VEDQVGATHQVEIPFAFLKGTFVAAPGFNPATFATAYKNHPNVSYRTIRLDGQRIGFAPDFAPGALGKTNLPTFSITMLGPSFEGFEVGADNFLDSLSANFSFPDMQFAGVTIDSLGSLAGIPKMFAFEFPTVYLESGFDAVNSVAQVFARFLDLGSIPGLNFDALKTALQLPDVASLGIEFGDLSKIGGLISPNFDLSGLSAAIGTFGGSFPDIGVPDILDGISSLGGLSFDPSSWFSGLPKLLGGIDLVDILGSFGPLGDAPSLEGLGSGLPEIPGLTTEIIYKSVLGQQVPVGLIVRYQWNTTNLNSWPESSPIFENHFDKVGGPTAELTLRVTMSVQYTGDFKSVPEMSDVDAGLEAFAELKNFRINLIGSDTYKFIVLQFSSISFTAKVGADPKVEPNIASVDFDGALKYLMKLKDYLLPEGGLLGGGGGGGSTGLKFTPIFDLSSNHVAIGFDLGIPTIAVGVFSLSNLEVGMLVTVPFNGDDVTVAFHVCRKDKPFLLTVGIFGGGGFFAMELGTSGVRSLEISLEFGAATQLDIGVASGSISLMGGIYFAIRTDPTEQLELTGYVRLNGRLEVLCIVTVTVEFLLTLSYLEPPGSAKGRAQLTITVEVLFFSGDVTMEVEKEFGGNSTGSSPSGAGRVGPAAAAPDQPVRYSDLMTYIDYQSYTGAFA
jgi:hypothetical protein